MYKCINDEKKLKMCHLSFYLDKVPDTHISEAQCSISKKKSRLNLVKDIFK